MEVVKNACRRKWQQILLENGFLVPKKNAKNEKFGDLKLFNHQNFEDYLQKRVWLIIFKIKDDETGGGTRPKGVHAYGTPCSEHFLLDRFWRSIPSFTSLLNTTSSIWKAKSTFEFVAFQHLDHFWHIEVVGKQVLSVWQSH